MGKRNCSWRGAEIGRQNPPEPQCTGSASGATFFALLRWAQQLQKTRTGVVATSAVYRTITGYRRVPDYGVPGVLRVLLCGINGTRDLVVHLTGKAPDAVLLTMLRPISDEARLAARNCTLASLNNHEANNKGEARMECVAANHFVMNRGWEKVINACLQHPNVRQHQVAGKVGSQCATCGGRILHACVC